MIDKAGKLYINGNLFKYRYDKNEPYGVDVGKQIVCFMSIIIEFKILNLKFTISRYTELKHQKDFMTLAFDPPQEQIDKMKLNAGEVAVNKEEPKEKVEPEIKKAEDNGDKK